MSGYWMPANVARRLQAHRDLRHHYALDIEIHPVALTKAQCIEHNLPETPLKPGDKRAAKWRAAMGREATEIDALAALRPDILRQIAEDAVKPFWDESLDRRFETVRAEWRTAARERLEAHPEYQVAMFRLFAQHQQVQSALENYASAHASITSFASQVELPPFVAPQPELNDNDLPAPMYTSTDDFVTGTRAILNYKRQAGFLPGQFDEDAED
jgi:hypothetical protein